MATQPSTADYWVGPIIGQGSFSQVHFAKHKTSNRPVAIKVTDQVTFRKNPKILNALLQEQLLLSTKLREMEFVTRLLSSFYDTSCLYMVLELCEGGDLEQLIQRNVGPNLQWLSSIPHYLCQVQQSIDFLHACDIVHCDIKPANILLTSEGRVKLTDFGSALDLSKPSSCLEDSIRGTTEYSAPELLRNDNSTPPKAIDYWSFGCLAIAMYTGRSPFYREGSEYLTVQAIMENSKDDTTILEQLESVGGLGTQSTFKTEHVVDSSFVDPFRGLLQFNPTKRFEIWIEISESLMTNSKEFQQNRLILPQASWKKDVDSCELRDGGLGWVVFSL